MWLLWFIIIIVVAVLVSKRKKNATNLRDCPASPIHPNLGVRLPLATAVLTSRANVVFPPRSNVQPVPMPPCKLYYPSYVQLSQEQRRFFAYWRYEYERGNALPADDTYRYLYAYEIAWESRSGNELELLWVQLWRKLGPDDSVARGLAHWIVDLRLQQGKPAFDDITASMLDRAFVFDLALAAGSTPPVDTVWALRLPFSFDSEMKTRVKRLLRDVDFSALLKTATQQNVKTAQRVLFSGLGWPSQRLQQFGPMDATIARFSESLEVREAVYNIVMTIQHLSGAPPPRYVPPPVYRKSEFPEPPPESVEMVVRKAIGSLPDANEMDGLLWSIDRVFDDTGLILLLLVLWLSELKPFIEGRIAFSGELRKRYEAIGRRLGLQASIGSLRRDYWMLSHGPRAVWTLSPSPASLNDIKTGITDARFTRSMQQLLLGSAVRGEAIHALAVRLARRRRKSGDEVKAIMGEETGATPAATR